VRFSAFGAGVHRRAIDAEDDHGCPAFALSRPPHGHVRPGRRRAFDGGSGCVANVARGELDCVGLVITTDTPARIVVRVGSDYREHHSTISDGDAFEFGVETARFHGVVHHG
jgi:hypothetical protein